MGVVGGNGTGKLKCERRGRRLGALYPLPLRGSTPSQCEGDVAKRQRETAAVSGWLLPQAKDGGRETKKSLPQSNATHLTALPSRGTRFCLRLGAQYKIDRFAHKCSLFPPPAAVTFVARRGAETAGAKFSEFGHLAAGASPRPTL